MNRFFGFGVAALALVASASFTSPAQANCNNNPFACGMLLGMGQQMGRMIVAPPPRYVQPRYYVQQHAVHSNQECIYRNNGRILRVDPGPCPQEGHLPGLPPPPSYVYNRPHTYCYVQPNGRRDC